MNVHTRRSTAAGPRGDELGHIQGVTRAIERRLRACGVLTFRQMADMTPVQLADRLKSMRGVSVSRIEQQNWIGQAREMANRPSGGDKEMPNGEGADHPPRNLVNQGFVVDLFLDAGGGVHLTQVLHVKSNHGDAWEGWDERRLLDFMISVSGAKVPVPDVADSAPLAAAAADEVPDSVRLKGVEIGGGGQAPLLRGEEFAVKLNFDLAELLRATTRPLAYKATLRATSKTDGSKLVLAETTGRLAPASDEVTIPVPKGKLDAGFYSLRADLAVTRASGPAENPLRGEASVPAGLFQVV